MRSHSSDVGVGSRCHRGNHIARTDGRSPSDGLGGDEPSGNPHATPTSADDLDRYHAGLEVVSDNDAQVERVIGLVEASSGARQMAPWRYERSGKAG